MDEKALKIQALKTKFSKLNSFRKSKLRQFYLLHYPELTENGFRRILYSLEKQKVIVSIGAGVFVLLDTPFSFGKTKFVPALSPLCNEINSIVRLSFPHIRYLIWETKILHEFMTHQPGQNYIILEIEKDVCESVFNRLLERFIGKIFLEPDRAIYERYILNTADSILVLRLVTQSPTMKINGVPTVRLEKILVDIFADENHFYIFQGQELITIYENAFSLHWVNEKTLFRYAGRRKVADKIQTFITTKTQIKLTVPLEP